MCLFVKSLYCLFSASELSKLDDALFKCVEGSFQPLNRGPLKFFFVFYSTDTVYAFNGSSGGKKNKQNNTRE